MICAPCSGTTPWRTTMEKHRLAIPEALRRARRTGFYHGVGASSLLGSGPSLCPTPNTRKSSHLAYKDTPFGVCSSPPRKYNLINRQAGPSGSPPSTERPGFSLARALVLCDSVPYVEDHKPIDVYIRNTMFIGT